MKEYKAVVVGASAGALEALTAIFSKLPKNFPLPIMLVVHLPPDKNSILAEVLALKTKIETTEAEDKEPILPGKIYIAPPNYHLMVEKNMCLSLSSDELVFFSRPSIDVLFETAADAYGDGLIGIVLTGANKDGAEGLKMIVANGGQAVVQNPDNAFASAMPESAIALCPEAQVYSLPEISEFLQKIGSA